MPYPKSQLEKRIDELYSLLSSIGGGGVGKNVGFNNEIFNCYEDAFNRFFANKITGSLYGCDFNHSEGRGNTMTNCDVGHTEGIGNTMTECREGCHAEGCENTLTGCKSTHAQGKGNTVTNASNGLIAGYNNVVSGSQQLLVDGYGNEVSVSRFDGYGAVFGNSHKIKGAFANSLCTGTDNKNTGSINGSVICGDQADVSGSILDSIIAGYDIKIISPGTVMNCLVIGASHIIGNASDCIIGGVGAANVANHLMVLAYNGNMFTVDNVGNVAAAGTITPSGADYAEYFEWADGNPEGEDRRGLLVTLDGDKLIPAHGDDFIGVVSAAPSVVGNGAGLNWSGKYKTDVFGSIIRDEKGEPLLSEDYDPEREYVPRSKRKEWSAVGLVGRLVITDNGACKVGGYVSARNGLGAASNSPTRARVLRRIDGTHVEVLVR